ncbi:MAG TPA: hypothetical protein VE779_17835 [Candidatus Angelobacter sp.]|jgi:hypothetical protein|nr:hypothetical protein [Candidatus Angelobacter sp.]
MDTKIAALEYICPACGAMPKEPCVRLDGKPMSEPHTKRKNLTLIIRPRRKREDLNQAAPPTAKDSASKS